MKRARVITALLTTTAAIGYDWKMDGDALAMDGEGNPVWIGADAKEMTVKGTTVADLQGEAKRHRVRAETAETKLAKFDGITDADAARTALETVKDIGQGDLIAKGKLDEVRAEITKSFETRIQTAEQKAQEASRRADDTLLDSVFSSSEFARERLAVPVEMVRATFGDRFKVEDGKVVAKTPNGETIYSQKNVGEVAGFDEALELTINGYKYKDTILKAQDASGSGSGGGGGARGRGRVITRSDFEQLTPPQQAETAAKIGSGEMQFAE